MTIQVPVRVTSRLYGEGVFSIPSTITIARQRAGLGAGFPIPFLATTHPKPAGTLRGVDDMGSILHFNSGITGRYIKTEDYNAGDPANDVVSLYWNDGNVQGNTSLRYNHQARVQDLFILGDAQLHPYPWHNNNVDLSPDPYGPNFVRIADGLCMQGSAHHAERLHFYAIPGACLILKNGSINGGQGGVFGPIEDGGIGFSNLAANVYMQLAMYGLVTPLATDTKLDHIYGGGFVKDGIVGGINTNLTNSHIAGADRDLVAPFPIHCKNIYMEAARIGVHLTNKYIDPETGVEKTCAGSFRSTIEGLQIGPGTNWYRSVLIEGEGSGSSITGVTGHIKAEDATDTDVAGVELESDTYHCTIQMVVEHMGVGTSLILGGEGHTIDVNGGWAPPDATTYDGRIVEVRTSNSVKRSEVRIKGSIKGGYALDLLNSSQATVNGLGTVFDIKVALTGGAQSVRLPTGKTYADLVGTKIYVDGTLQT